MVARGTGAAGPVLLACRQWDPLGLARWLPSLGVGAWRCAPLLPWRVQCPVCVCAALAAGSVSGRRWCVVGLWLVCGVFGPSPLLAEVPVCYSPPLLAGFRCLWWCAVPRHSWLGSPGGGVVCWGCGWCVVWLVPRHSWRRFLCATPRHSWLGFAAGGGVQFPATPDWGLLAAVVRGVWCVVCGVWCAAVVCWWGCGCGWSLATPGGGSCVLLPATPSWVSLPVAVGGPRHSWLRALGAVPRHSWLGSAGGGGVWWGCGWCVVWLVPRHSWRRFLCATPRHSWLGFAAGGGVRFPATPGWGLLAVVVRGVWCVVCGVWCAAVVCWRGCGWCVVWLVPRHSWRRFLCATPRHSWLGFAAGGGGGRSLPLLAGVRWRRWCVVCGGGVLVGSWLVCGVVGPSPLLEEVLVCYSPPLLAGFRCRWLWAVLATPG